MFNSFLFYIENDIECITRIEHIFNEMSSRGSTQSLGAFLQCHKNPFATFKCLESFRTHYPDATLVLLSDNSYDFSEMGKYFNCIYINATESLSLQCQYLPVEDRKPHMKKLIQRVADAYRQIPEDYVLWLEDDVFVNGKIADTFDYDMNGQSLNNINHIRMDELQRHYPLIDTTITYIRNGQGGTVFRKKTILEYFDDEPFIDTLLDRYESYGAPWYQDFVFSLIVILKDGSIGPYYGHGDIYANIISPTLCVQHQYKLYYGVPLPNEIAHLVKM